VRIVEVAVRLIIGVDAARDRAGQEFAEVIFNAGVAPVDRDLADDVARRRVVGNAAEVAGRVEAVEPAGGMDFDDRVRTGAAFVVARRPVSLPLASSNLSTTSRMPSSLSRSKMPSLLRSW
jgi:hypothetical protein